MLVATYASPQSCFDRSPPLLRVLLVLDVFLPELFLQLRIRLGFGRLAQAPRHDIIVTAVGNRVAGAAGRALALATTVTRAAFTATIALLALVRLEVAGTRLAIALARTLGARRASGVAVLFRARAFRVAGAS